MIKTTILETLFKKLQENGLDTMDKIIDNNQRVSPKLLDLLLGDYENLSFELTPEEQEALFIWLNRDEIPQA